MRIPAAVAFGSGHEVGERNKIEVASVADDDEDNLLLMLMSREVHGRRRVEAKNDRLKIILAKKSYTSTILYINSRGLLDPNTTPPLVPPCFHKPKPQTQKIEDSRSALKLKLRRADALFFLHVRHQRADGLFSTADPFLLRSKI